MSGLNVRRLTLLVWLLAALPPGWLFCRCSARAPAAPADGHAAAAGDRAGDLYRRRLLAPSGGHHLGALAGAILVNALSNGLGLLGVNIFWMGAIKGGLILVVLALGGQTQRRRGMSQITLKTSASAEQTASSPLAWLSRAGFGVITLLAIALFGWANPVIFNRG